LQIWTPFLRTPETATHTGSVGLLGNPNDVGTYLAAPALAAIVLAVIAGGRRRWIYAAIGALLVAGVAASATRTAVGSLIIALIVFALFHSRRVAVAVATSFLIILVTGLVMLSPSTTLGRGARELITAARQHNYQQL